MTFTFSKRMGKYLSVLALTFTAMSITGCTKSSITPEAVGDTATMVSKDTFYVMNYDINELKISNAFDSGRRESTIQNLALDEISGIAIGSASPARLWCEEDSGNENKIYALDVATGNQLASVRLSVDNRDWEDMSIAPGPMEGQPYIYLAETGDNKFSYKTKYIYRFAEPVLAGPLSSDEEYPSAIDKITFQYPDGIKNTEAVMIDPATKDIYMISKEGQATVYVARYPQSTTGTIILTKLETLPISTITAADISPDGKEILIKNYDRIFYWKKKNDETITQLLRQKPERLKYVPEPKGEAICWDRDGSGFYTTSEMTDNEPVAIYRYKRQ